MVHNAATAMTCDTVPVMASTDDHSAGGLDLGYARVSTTKQSLDRQLEDVQNAAGHADPRMTRRHDRGRHASYAVTAWLAGEED
jgi:hypothetical protein